MIAILSKEFYPLIALYSSLYIVVYRVRPDSSCHLKPSAKYCSINWTFMFNFRFKFGAFQYIHYRKIVSQLSHDREIVD